MPFEPSGNLEMLALSQSDADLFRALKAGQISALGTLYDRHAALVYGLALKVLGVSPEAEDLTQDIFLNLANSSFDPNRGSLRTFLAILTRSRAIDRIRSRSSAASVLQRITVSPSEAIDPNSPVEHVFQAEQSAEVRAALAQLSDNQQQILKMAYYDGLSKSEIATQLALPLGTVKARARRGLLKLRETLANYLQ
jgi:RNA polymerase sigma-70 factor (ECF subfamily)